MPDVVGLPTGSVVDDLGSRTVHDLNVAWTKVNVAALEARRGGGGGSGGEGSAGSATARAASAAFLEELPALARSASGYRAMDSGPAATAVRTTPRFRLQGEARYIGKVTGASDITRSDWSAGVHCRMINRRKKA